MNAKIRRVLCLSAVLALVSACAPKSGASKTEPSVAPGANDRFATAKGRTAAVKILEGEGRDEYQKPDEVIRNLELKEGDVVCEVGAGSGYFTPYLSKAVGQTGRVYAQDPQREFVELIEQKKKQMGLANLVSAAERPLRQIRDQSDRTCTAGRRRRDR